MAGHRGGGSDSRAVGYLLSWYAKVTCGRVRCKWAWRALPACAALMWGACRGLRLRRGAAAPTAGAALVTQASPERERASAWPGPASLHPALTLQRLCRALMPKSPQRAPERPAPPPPRAPPPCAPSPPRAPHASASRAPGTPAILEERRTVGCTLMLFQLQVCWLAGAGCSRCRQPRLGAPVFCPFSPHAQVLELPYHPSAQPSALAFMISLAASSLDSTPL